MSAVRPTLPRLFHVVLHEPEIPNNTGNIGRTCVATGCALHLIKPLGFDTSEKECRRAGLDYWPRLGVQEHESWSEFLKAPLEPDQQPVSPERLWVFSTKASRHVFDADFRQGDVLVFGKETSGLPSEILHAHQPRALRFPMVAGERSLNLATAVCAAVYEGVRQLHEKGFVRIDGNGMIRAGS
jgi:tRNA (cytidine/uridine-2'-O-)-methyltransferase